MWVKYPEPTQLRSTRQLLRWQNTLGNVPILVVQKWKPKIAHFRAKLTFVEMVNTSTARLVRIQKRTTREFFWTNNPKLGLQSAQPVVLFFQIQCFLNGAGCTEQVRFCNVNWFCSLLVAVTTVSKWQSIETVNRLTDKTMLETRLEPSIGIYNIWDTLLCVFNQSAFHIWLRPHWAFWLALHPGIPSIGRSTNLEINLTAFKA